MEKRLDLLIDNYESLKKVNASSWMGLIIHGCALEYTLKDKKINTNLVNESMETIRENTSIFSDFRGKSSINTAIILSFQANPKSSFDEILNIHKKLKLNKFCSGDCLALVSNVIFENKNKINIDECIEKMRYVYKSMIQNHPFSIGVEEYMITCIIAISARDIEEELNNMEIAYEYLMKNGFRNRRTLQSLSHVLSFNKNKETLNRCIEIKKELEKNKCKIHEFGYPLIGVMALIDIKDVKHLIEKIKYISDTLKEHQGYGNFILGERYRNMISAVIALSKYIDDIEINSIIMDKIISNINQAMNIATNAATTSSIVIYNSST
ncbi:DUF4003 family protein [Paraclostridium bifermentans]|uniref:DUF4003 family protein n=1 Tax=Paraclostridium bifermentans TaxID=1490 RepID=UPI002911EFE7|nr:DUF4003 family protein [Paraclostridium bifermentans]MDU3801462.1 DUF4003 family protein [Paraclostridium bifermentans]